LCPEINFFYGACGLLVTATWNYILTDNHKQLSNLVASQAGLVAVCLSAVSAVATSLAMLCLVMVGGPMCCFIVGVVKYVALTYVALQLNSDGDASWTMLAGLALSFVGAGFTLKKKLKIVK